MREYETIESAKSGAVLAIRLNRPEIHNAIDDRMISELTEAFKSAAEDASVRVVILAANGKSFCVGADLNWMARMADAPGEANIEDARKLAAMLRAVRECAKPVIARVHGLTVGGGNGLVAACDLAVGSTDAAFRVAETRLGIVPAVISPYLLRKIGDRACREIFFTARNFSAAEAAAFGLINKAVPPSELDREVESLAESLLRSGPMALSAAKELLLRVGSMDEDEAGEYTARMIADLRSSPEGREGIRAFLEKRDPSWVGKKK